MSSNKDLDISGIKDHNFFICEDGENTYLFDVRTQMLSTLIPPIVAINGMNTYNITGCTNYKKNPKDGNTSISASTIAFGIMGPAAIVNEILKQVEITNAILIFNRLLLIIGLIIIIVSKCMSHYKGYVNSRKIMM